jgi:hypothetical protein
MSDDKEDRVAGRDYHLKRPVVAQATAVEHLTRAEAPRRFGLKPVRQ